MLCSAQVHTEECTSLDDERQVIHLAGNVDDRAELPAVENLCGHLAHHLLICFDAFAMHRGQNQTTLLPVRWLVDKQDPLPHNPTGAYPINDWADLEVVYGVYEEIAIGFRSVEDRPVKTQKLETHDLSIAPVGFQQEAWLVSQPGEDRAEQREAGWTWWPALRHRSYPFRSHDVFTGSTWLSLFTRLHRRLRGGKTF